MSSLPIRARRKAVIYVTSGIHILVFREPDYPEAGVQPPGGTVTDGETTAEGAARELFEETGIRIAPTDLVEIGMQDYEYTSGGTLHRHARTYFHAVTNEPIDRTWTCVETNPDGPTDHEILFALFWTPLTADLVLFGELDHCLAVLRQRIGLT
jgi:8-oxo-dGTP pyrophosphatase MutT (NUDIX family)